MREINVFRAGDPVHVGDKALTRETPAKRGRVNRYADHVEILHCKTEQYSHIVLYIYIDVKEINEQLITNVLPNGMDIFLTNRGKPR
jgi:hypothetical protein